MRPLLKQNDSISSPSSEAIPIIALQTYFSSWPMVKENLIEE